MDWFKFRYEWFDLMSDLTAEEQQAVMNAIYAYTQDDSFAPDLQRFDRVVKAVWKSIKADIDAETKYIETRKECGSKGGKAKASNSKQNVATDSLPTPSQVDDVATDSLPTPSHTKNTRIQETKNTRNQDIKNDDDSAEQRSTPPVITLPLNDKSEYPVSQTQVDGWAQLYPAVDVMQQLRNMKGWLDSNPKRRKTRNGVVNFVTSWLSREQDRGRTAPQEHRPKQVAEAQYSQRPIDPKMNNIPDDLLRDMERFGVM